MMNSRITKSTILMTLLMLILLGCENVVEKNLTYRGKGGNSYVLFDSDYCLYFSDDEEKKNICVVVNSWIHDNFDMEIGETKTFNIKSGFKVEIMGDNFRSYETSKSLDGIEDKDLEEK